MPLITITGIFSAGYLHAKKTGAGDVPSLRIVTPDAEGKPTAKGEFVVAWAARMDNLVPDAEVTKADGTTYTAKAHYRTVRWSENNATTVINHGDTVEFALEVRVFNGKPSYQVTSLVNHIPATPAEATADSTPEAVNAVM